MKFEWREAYCPAHFGNSYEAMWPRQMAAYLEELNYWGFNRYGDWMTTTDVSDPYSSDATWSLSMEQFARKKAALAKAFGLGLKNTLIIAPNHVYLDQLQPHLLAQKGNHIIGQLLCPSIPEARAIIVRNCENVFRDLAKSGISLEAITGFAYDYGGCSCEKCSPWILTWAELWAQIHSVAQKYFPSVEPLVCTWWWKPQEYRLFFDWASRHKPNWLRGAVYHIPYDHTVFQAGEATPPDGCQALGFIHGGYSDRRKDVDIYGKMGPVVAPRRLPETLQNLGEKGAGGFQFYSEGIFDDVNKAIVASLASGKAHCQEDALREYATRYFGANTGDAGAWAQWLGAWGERSSVDLDAAAREFERLAAHATCPEQGKWRLEQWKCKLELEKLDRALARGGDKWDAPRLALADEFWAAQETLHRHVYGVGPVRHVLNLKTSESPWIASWRRLSSQAAPTLTALPSET